MKPGTIVSMLLLVLSLPAATWAGDIPDTPQNRLVSARKYLDTVSMKDMLRDTITETARNYPQARREAYVAYMNEAIRVEAIEDAALASMARHFTVDELNALAAFYASPEGSSAMKKFGAYLADVMPVIQKEAALAEKRFDDQTHNKGKKKASAK